MPEQTLTDQTVLVIGGTRDLGLAVVEAVAAAGGTAIVAGRDLAKARAAAAEIPRALAVELDITNEASITAALAQVGHIDHVVVLTSAHHNAPVSGLDHAETMRAFDTKVIGPLIVAKHVAHRLPTHGSIVLFSGVAAWNPTPGYTVMGIANGAVSFAASQLARELAPVRVNAISPGIIDSGSWDGMGASKDRFLKAAAAETLVGRHGVNDDVTDAVLWLLTATFVSGETIHVEGGSRH
jgi:NAD(P)-dependent dehydrogenase (short-subunit alcohol dehydrogenase family)